MINNSVTKLFNIQYPIIQGGMIWVSGGRLAAAVSNTGGLGLVGAGSMKPELLKEHLVKALSLTKNPIGINVPLLYEKSEEQIQTAINLGIKIFFTSAGNPKQFTKLIHDNGGIVVHVISSPEQAVKAEAAGVDAIVAEGFEAGGHNGREELTTMVLIPLIKNVVKIPIISAGGIATGAGVLAALSLGADGVQMGTRFLMTKESSAHQNYKNLLLNSTGDYTRLLMKAKVPVRLVKNKFSDEIALIEQRTSGDQQKKLVTELLGSGRAKIGMHDGDMIDGELEAGQIASLIKDLPTCQELMTKIISDYNYALKNLQTL